MGVFVEVHAGKDGQLGGALAEVRQRIYNLIVSRTLLAAFLAALVLALPGRPQQPATPAQPPPTSPQAQPQEQEPPEEDKAFKPREYDFNPLKASQSVTAGDFYFKKGNFAAARGRYKDATLFDPGSAEGFEKLGEAAEKLRDFATARDSYAKYLELAPTAKDAEIIRKRMEKLPVLPTTQPRNDR
jgi:tetratricopeptide (TPR) repeat protein